MQTAVDQPNPLAVAWSIFTVQRRVRPPRPAGRSAQPDLGSYGDVLTALASGGTGELAGRVEDLEKVVSTLGEVDPDRLTPSSALAFWLNLYNAAALVVAARASAAGLESVLGVPGAFGKPVVRVVGERLSLDAIEHAKVRRFGDPRIHGALVCGSVSCPTLRAEPYQGDRLDLQLDDQMRAFLAGGGAIADPDAGVLHLSRVFSWFGGDFARPRWMPTWLPASKSRVLAALGPWLTPELRAWVEEERPRVRYQPYDWGLRCAVR